MTRAYFTLLDQLLQVSLGKTLILLACPQPILLCLISSCRFLWERLFSYWLAHIIIGLSKSCASWSLSIASLAICCNLRKGGPPAHQSLGLTHTARLGSEFPDRRWMVGSDCRCAADLWSPWLSPVHISPLCAPAKHWWQLLCPFWLSRCVQYWQAHPLGVVFLWLPPGSAECLLWEHPCSFQGLLREAWVPWGWRQERSPTCDYRNCKTKYAQDEMCVGKMELSFAFNTS